MPGGAGRGPARRGPARRELRARWRTSPALASWLSGLPYHAPIVATRARANLAACGGQRGSDPRRCARARPRAHTLEPTHPTQAARGTHNTQHTPPYPGPGKEVDHLSTPPTTPRPSSSSPSPHLVPPLDTSPPLPSTSSSSCPPKLHQAGRRRKTTRLLRSRGRCLVL